MPYPILAYHNVAPMPRLALNRRLYLAPWRFALQMRTLAALGYRGVSLREGLPYLAGNKSGRIVILTFDDGYRDTLTHALPVLRRFGFSATCFLVAAELGRYNRWDTVHWEVRKALMNPGDVEHWLAAGMDIGSHTLNHPYLTRISGAEQLLEIERSKRMLEATFSRPIEHFCYPYGDFDADCVRAVRASGYVSAVTTKRGFASAPDDLHTLKRICVNGERGWLRFVLQITTGYENLRGAKVNREAAVY